MVFGKRMVHNAVDNETIHPSAFGSVPGRNAQDALLEKLISYDMLRIERKNGAIFDCDAKGCYDRILPGFSTLHTRRLGMPTNWAKFFSIFWRKCTHHIRTKFGISEKSFAMEENELLHGIGQGNGAGPALWLSHLIVMFDTIQKYCKGWIFSSPNQEVTFESPGVGYVDDVTLGTCNKNEDETPQSLIQRINNIAAFWEKLLHTNGGMLELKKCFWVLIIWKWIDGVPKMSTVRDTPATLDLIQSQTKENITVDRKEASEAPKVLGCHMSADGDWKTEYVRWRTTSKDFSTKVNRARFDRICGSKIYPIMWVPKFKCIAQSLGLAGKNVTI